MNRLQVFQKQNNLKADGIIGIKTLNKMKTVFGISSNERLAMFVGQIVHETGNFRFEEENLNYSVNSLLKVFRKYFPTAAKAEEYAYKPKKIANLVYANRMGNGPEASGDGWKFRGRGSIQLTGKNNYEIFANKVRDLQILCDPDLVKSKYFFECGLFYFTHRGLWIDSDEINNESIIRVSRKINGGLNGYEERIRIVKKMYKILCSSTQ